MRHVLLFHFIIEFLRDNHKIVLCLGIRAVGRFDELDDSVDHGALVEDRYDVFYIIFLIEPGLEIRFQLPELAT